MLARSYSRRVEAKRDWTELDEASLARCIAAARSAGDAAAEAELYRRLSPRVRLYGLRHLRDPHAAADLVQQVLLLTVERLRAGKLRDPERLASFVLGICRMVVLDLRRGRARQERLLVTFADDVPMGDPAVAPRLDHERLLNCLEGLAERERSVLVMTFYDDQPSDAVAGQLGLTAGNVRVIRHRGIDKLRRCVDGGARRAA